MPKLKKINRRKANTYCFQHFGKTLSEKLEEVQQAWLDKLEDQILEEQKASEGESL